MKLRNIKPQNGQIKPSCMYSSIDRQELKRLCGWVFINKNIFFTHFIINLKNKGASHGDELKYLFGMPFFNESLSIPWYGIRLNYRYFNREDQEISNYTMHLIANFAR